MFYELAVSTWGPEEIAAINRVIASNRFTMGDHVARFEAAFATYHGRNYAVMVNSGSSANLVSVAALFYKKQRPLQRGDEVIVPAIAWATTYHPLQQFGLKLKIGEQPILNDRVFAAILVMVIITTLLTPPLLQWSFSRHGASNQDVNKPS